MLNADGLAEGEDLPTNSLCVVRRVAAKKRVVGDTPHGGGKYQECGWAVATEWLAVGVILDDDRHAGLPGPARQPESAGKFHLPRIEFERRGGAVVAIHQAHLVGDFGIVAPKLDRTDVLVVIAAKQHHHRHQELAGKHRQRDAAAQPGLLGVVAALVLGR